MRHPDQIKDRITNVDQIKEVIVAMRALAAAHALEAERHLKAIRAQTATVASAMSEALALLPQTPRAAPLPPEGHLQMVVGAAQGFTGTYNESIVRAVLEEMGGGEHKLLLVGQRCVAEFDLLGHQPVWSASMVAHAAEVSGLAGRIVDFLFASVEAGEVGMVDLAYAEPGLSRQDVTFRRLLPFDLDRIAPAGGVARPHTTLPPQRLLARLIEEYVFTEVCEALMLGFAAENDARMGAMMRARSNVGRIAEELRREHHQARQEQTTTEIIELAGSVR